MAQLHYRHMYYGDPKTVDLNVLQKQALSRSLGDIRNEPEFVTIHHHKRDEPCPGKKHEEFKPAEKKVES